jgi:hypothetical protein
VVGILVAIFDTVNIRRVLSFVDLAGTPFLTNLAGTSLLTWEIIGMDGHDGNYLYV